MPNIYFDKRELEIIGKMQRGEVTSVCRKAVREWEDDLESLEAVRKKVNALLQEQLEIKAKLDFLQPIQLRLEVSEVKRKEEEETLKNSREKEEKEKEKRDYDNLIAKSARNAVEWGAIEEDAIKAAKEFYAKPSKERGGWKRFLIERGYLKNG